MGINFQNKVVTGLLLLAFQFSFGQKKEQIGTETVNVVKPYTPTISDAFKVKETPSLDEESTAKRETVKYSIFSFPVASTFTPSKGKAEGVEKEEKEHLFKNYATLGAGSFGTFVGELFVHHDVTETNYVGAMLKHHSSQGGIKGVELEDRFYDTSIDVTFGGHEKAMAWNLDLGYQNQIYNWYGLPKDFGTTLNPMDRNIILNGINPEQGYNTISAGGRISFTKSIFNDISLKFNHFTDLYDSAENRFYAKPSFQIDIMETAIKTNVIVDYVGGSFKKNYENTNVDPIKYGFTNFGIAPSFVVLKDDWTLNIGAGIFYSLDNVNNNNKFFVYPQLSASYKVVSDFMIFYAGAEGSLEQNSYQDFVQQNPFLSPTLNIAPTDKQFDIFAGLKGKLSSTVSYNLRGSFLNERNRALFRSNDYNERPTNENYAFGNSMKVVYDDMRTLSFYGELKADISQNVSFGVNGTYNTYTNDFESEAWNLPKIRVNSNIDFEITKKWFAGVNAFYVGERKDYKTNTDLFYIVAPSENPTILKSYFDVNANVGFKYNDRITAFLKANNILNKSYEKWLDYPVQSLQLLAGVSYKFDF